MGIYGEVVKYIIPKTILLAALIAASLWLPCQAAESTRPSDPDTITFAQYRDWRVNLISERQHQIAARLAAAGLNDADRQRLEREKSYYDRQAAMPEGERDRLFRARFDQIDTNHDGIIDRAERAAWREKEHSRYHRETAAADTGH
jgi:hypothetical protein